jgi:predicted MFS family arabinose efflux permease
LADPTRRGHIVGTVVSGILTGILLSRTISGFVAGIAGWRAVYVVATVATVVLALILLRSIPALEPRPRISYPALLGSVFSVVRREPAVRWTLVLGATGFAMFTMFWTALTFLLSSPPFSYSVTVIGLFGLIGLTGAIAAQRAGRLHDRGWDLPATGLAWALALASWVISLLSGHTVIGIIAVVVVLDVAVQGLNLLNQTRLFSVAPDARSRLNTAFVTNNFIGGAAGSALAALLWTAGGWTAISLAGGAMALFGLAAWALGRRGPLQVTPTAVPHQASPPEGQAS